MQKMDFLRSFYKNFEFSENNIENIL